MEGWQRIVNDWDHKAHRKRGWITVTLTGGFRAIDDERAARRVSAYQLDDGETFEEVLRQAIEDMKELLPKARDLDRRIAKRKTQPPHEREYLYESTEK